MAERGGVPWEGEVKSGEDRGEGDEDEDEREEREKKTDLERSECQFGEQGTRRPTWRD